MLSKMVKVKNIAENYGDKQDISLTIKDQKTIINNSRRHCDVASLYRAHD